jgi:nucleotide-binding universal stress UspA family protein
MMARPIVVGVDGTADSIAALSAAADWAMESGAAIVVVHVRHESGMVLASSAVSGAGVAMNDALDEVESMSRERAADVLAGRGVCWRFEAASGDPAYELIAAACREHATTIVVGGRNHGVVGGLVIGSVAQKLVRQSPVSVLVVRDGLLDRVVRLHDEHLMISKKHGA